MTKFDVTFIMSFEDGELTHDEVVAGFQDGIDTGQVWHLQGSYGRMAQALIDNGYCTPAPRRTITTAEFVNGLAAGGTTNIGD